MSATSAAISSARAAAGRAVHIKIHPRPRNITESREILRVLQSYGEVTMFKNLKVQPNGRQITLTVERHLSQIGVDDSHVKMCNS